MEVGNALGARQGPGDPGRRGSGPVESREAPPNCTVSLTSQRNPAKLPEVMGTSRGNPACRGTFGGRRKAVRDRFALQGGTGDFP